MKYSFLIIISTILSSFMVSGQEIEFEAYVYESGNRGYLNMAKVVVKESESEKIVAELFSDIDGVVSGTLEAGKKYKIEAIKDMFHSADFDLDLTDKKEGEKAFLKMELKRAPGYTFEITMAEKRYDVDTPVDAIKDTRIEVYNNTKRESVMEELNYMAPDFKVNMVKGNHYTILIRKKGYLAKRMEAFVDVEGCILCFEGIGSVRPGVTDNLSERNDVGVLLANVELEKVFEGKTIEINSLYYDLGKWNIKKEGREELDKVITLIKDNPDINLELGSHTDARGSSESNTILSEKRAKSAVDYILQNSDIEKERLISRGYGESIIINRCVEGVKCSEEEHALNRRTELKILGTFEHQKPFVSLVKMKQEEYMDDLISELANQEQVVVTSEDQADFLNETKTIDEEILEKGIDKKASKKAKANIDSAKKIDAAVDAAMEDIEKVEVNQNIENTLEGSDDTAVFEKVLIEEKVETAVNEEVVSEEIVSEEMPAVNNLGINGSKIVIVESKKPIEKDHKIYQKHASVLEYFHENGNVLYMIGEFKNKEEANDFIKKVVKFEYPGAYPVELMDGKIKY